MNLLTGRRRKAGDDQRVKSDRENRQELADLARLQVPEIDFPQSGHAAFQAGARSAGENKPQDEADRKIEAIVPAAQSFPAIVLNVEVRLVPTSVMAVMMATAISEARRPYSIAVTPCSDFIENQLATVWAI
jgi:hypothetical protein